jgi:hypothetical protein
MSRAKKSSSTPLRLQVSGIYRIFESMPLTRGYMMSGKTDNGGTTLINQGRLIVWGTTETIFTSLADEQGLRQNLRSVAYPDQGGWSSTRYLQLHRTYACKLQVACFCGLHLYLLECLRKSFPFLTRMCTKMRLFVLFPVLWGGMLGGLSRGRRFVYC